MLQSTVRQRPQPQRTSGAPKRSFTEIVLLALLALVPVVFCRDTTEVFEFPKTELLATGAIILGAIFLAGELARLRHLGLPAWVRTAPGRVVSDMRRDPLGTAILLFLASALISTATSIRPELSIFGAAESYAGLKTAFATAALYFASRSLASGQGWLDRAARAAGAATAVAVLYALLQFAHLDPFAWTRSATLSAMRRVPGTLGHANHLGAYIAMTLPLIAWLGSRAASRGARLLWIALAALSLTVLAATLSRGAWVGFAVGCAIYALLLWRAGRTAGVAKDTTSPARTRGARARSPRVVAATIVLALAALSAPLLTPLRPELVTRFRQITDLRAPSTQSRVHLWRAGIQMAADRPVLGVGPDAYIAAFPRYRTPNYWRIEWNGLSSKAHNELIQIAATQGALGLLAALLVVPLAGRAVLRAARHPAPEACAGAAAVGGALVAFAVQDLASFTVAATGNLAAVLAGWAAGLARGAEAGGSGAPETMPPAERPRPSTLDRGLALAIAAPLWIPLVLIPWRAETAAAPGLRDAMASPERVDSLARASAIAPWDARYASELGRSLLAQAFIGTADSTARWDLLARARAAFERAVRIGPEDAENQSLLARALAAQAALSPAQVPLDWVRAGFNKAIALDPESANVLELAAQGYLELGLTAEARAVSLRCAALFPDYALPMADIGIAALLDGRAADAADTLTLAIQRDWHGEEGAEAAAKSNYVAALREMRIRDVLRNASPSAPTPTRPRRIR